MSRVIWGRAYNSHFSAKLIFDLALLYSLWSLITNYRKELLDTHVLDLSSSFDSWLNLWYEPEDCTFPM